MNIYLFIGGGCVTADSADMFVEKMRDMSLFCKVLDIDQYMTDVASRCLLYSKSNIRTDSKQHFLQDLIDNDFVEVIGGVM